MDLSAIIFVVLALAWAVYLIPKALKHHDEMASDRLVEGHSDKVRILSRKSRTGSPEVVEVEHVETIERKPGRREQKPAAATSTVTRSAARKAAQRRRRVLSVLVLALAVVAGLAAFAIVPWWYTAVPGAMVVLFLVVARLSVRRTKGRQATVPTVIEAEPLEEVETTRSVTQVEPAPATQDLVDLLAEDTIGVPRQDIEAALADDGSLWDPLPVTLPTYVNKARARRTVRTIELTGINSSGHDQADTALAREARESTQDAAASESDSRKAAGA